MYRVYEDYLFSQGYFVADSQDGSGDEEHFYEALVALAHFAEIRITQNPELADVSMLKVAARNIGCAVPEPFYRGFPQTVRELSTDALLFDQIVHYIATYGFGLYDESGHSLLEGSVERLAFAENVDPKPFSIITQKEAEGLLEQAVKGFLASTRPLNDESYRFVRSYLMDYGWPSVACASKDTACRLLLELRDPTLAELLKLPDVIRLAEWLIELNYSGMTLNKLNLRNRDRALLVAVLDRLFARGDCDIAACLEKKRKWKGLLRHLHYRPTCDEARALCDAVFDSGRRSAYSDFERKMVAGDVRGGAESLRSSKGSAAVARKLAYLLSRCSSEQDFDFVLEAAATRNKIVLLQLLVHFLTSAHDKERTFRFVRMNRMLKHSETVVEAAARKSTLDEAQLERVTAWLREKLKLACYGTLGTVYADPAMRSRAIPLQESASQGGFGTLPRGTRLALPVGKKLRAFVYWEYVDDIDLSCIGLSENGAVTEFSWRTMAAQGLQSDAVVYSGDETDGYHGGSEYFDVDPALCRVLYPDIRYLIVCANVYSYGVSFSQCMCRAGYMTRDVQDSGEVFEPATVKSSFTVNCNSPSAFLFGLDLREDAFVWLNVAEEGTRRIAGEGDVRFLLNYIGITDAVNLYDLACMLAERVVDDPTAADVVFSDQELDLREGQEQIRSSNTARILELLN